VVELPNKPSIAIVGAGAVGGYYGARLAQAGNDVHFLMRAEYAHVREHGLVIKSVDGDFTLEPGKIHVYESPARMPVVDLVVVTLKSTDNATLPELIPPLLHERTIILTLQNGLGNEEFLASHFGAGRVLGGMAFTCINRIAPGVIHHSDHGHIRLGEMMPGLTDQAQRIAELFTVARIKASVIENLLAGRWTKLTWNIPFNGLTTLLDVPTDRLIQTPQGVVLVTRIIDEVVAAATAAGMTLPANIAQRQIELTRSMGSYLTSTQLDRRHGRPMEIDAIFTRPLQVARSHHLHTPHLELLDFTLRALNNDTATERL